MNDDEVMILMMMVILIMIIMMIRYVWWQRELAHNVFGPTVFGGAEAELKRLGGGQVRHEPCHSSFIIIHHNIIQPSFMHSLPSF